jgi:hypothetical protein
MNSQNNEDDSFNFSVIQPHSEQQDPADFSVRSLLGEEEDPQFVKPSAGALALHKSVEDVFSKLKNLRVQTGKSILKMESKDLPEESR